MKCYYRIVLAIACCIFLLPASIGIAAVNEQETPLSELRIQAFRIKGEEFVHILNNSQTPINLSAYRLQYFNHFDAIQASSSKLIHLSNILLPGGSSLVVSDEPIYACQGMIVSGESLGFTDSKGLLQLVFQQQSGPGGAVVFSVADSVAWSSRLADQNDEVQPTFSNDASFYWRDTVENDEPSNTAEPPQFSWVEAIRSAEDVCQVEVVEQENDEDTQVQRSPLTKVPTSQPPARIVPAVVLASSSASDDLPVYPVMSIGLEAPQITELLPNPGSPKKDANDEFIEFYNGNDKPFDLSGFKLRYGLSSVREYTFPQNTILEPKSFTPFFSAEASFTLANSGGQVKLVDPYGNVIGESDPYEKAKDDQSWALANGVWQWSLAATPGVANSISAPAVKAAAAQNGGSGTSQYATSGSAQQTSASAQSGGQGAQTLPEEQGDLHPMVLAALGSLTIGYVLYEYRQDITNKIYQLKRNRANRRADRSTSAGR